MASLNNSSVLLYHHQNIKGGILSVIDSTSRAHIWLSINHRNAWTRWAIGVKNTMELAVRSPGLPLAWHESWYDAWNVIELRYVKCRVSCVVFSILLVLHHIIQCRLSYSVLTLKSGQVWRKRSSRVQSVNMKLKSRYAEKLVMHQPLFSTVFWKNWTAGMLSQYSHCTFAKWILLTICN